MKKSNNAIFWFLRKITFPVLWLKYRVCFAFHTSKHIRRPCFILSNHQTVFDQFVVGTLFKFGINFVASNSIFRHGFQSWLMRILAHPIPYKKGSADTAAVKNMLSVINQGGAVGIFPSGNRSFFGEECNFRPGLGKLAKKMGVTVVVVQIRGGYHTKPRWSNSPGKGKMTASVIREISPQELNTFSAEQLDEIFQNELYFNEFEWNAKEQIVYKGKRKAEYLEAALFYCPQCQSLDKLTSEGNHFFCLNCGMRVLINDFGFFEKLHNAGNCPDSILKWSKEQQEYIQLIDYAKYLEKPLFCDEHVILSQASRFGQKTIGKGAIAFYSNKITICGKEFPIEELKDMSIQGIMRLIIYTDEGEFVADLPKRANAMKYMICGYYLKNKALGIKNGYYGY